jgi:bla regulator protein blaR1
MCAAAYRCGKTYASHLLAMACIVASARGGNAQGSNVTAPQEESAPIQLPAFDVVSIKPHKDEGMTMQTSVWIKPDSLSVSGLPLSMIIREALGVSEDRILNEPAWIKSDRYDIEAKVGPDDAAKLKTLSPQQRWQMLLPVLEDRFGLKFHRETVDLQAYTLVVAKGGAKLTAAKPAQPGEETVQPPSKADGAGGSARQPRMMMHGSAQGMTMECSAATMANLAQMISEQLGGTVVDKTDLTGSYDFTLSWTPDEGAGPTMVGSMAMTMRMPAGGMPPDGGTSQRDSGPSLFTALQEQLGLRLEARKTPVEVFVVDHVEQPSPN